MQTEAAICSCGKRDVISDLSEKVGFSATMPIPFS